MSGELVPRQPRNWFETTFGVLEVSPAHVYAHIHLVAAEEGDPDGGVALHVPASGKTLYVGVFETPTLEELRHTVRELSACWLPPLGAMSTSNVRADVRDLLADPGNAGAVFQVASQFNCLEMCGHTVMPDDGVTMYVADRTQGPACALACPAATVFRNYFVNGTGQCAPAPQLNTLSDVSRLLDNCTHRYWTMRNGYCLPTSVRAAMELGERLRSSTELQQAVVAAVGVGVHWSTEVQPQGHRVTQVLCSALPWSYSDALFAAPENDQVSAQQGWELFARLALVGAYKCTLAAAAVIARRRKSRVRVLLTHLGAGAFGNPMPWVTDALAAAVATHADDPLDVCTVSY